MLPLPQRRALEALCRMGMKQVPCTVASVLCFRGHIPQVPEEVTLWVDRSGAVRIGSERKRAWLWCTENELEGLARGVERERMMQER